MHFLFSDLKTQQERQAIQDDFKPRALLSLTSILSRSAHRRFLNYFSFCATVFLIVPLRPIVAEVPANLVDAYGNLFDIGVAIPSATLSDAEQVALGANFTAITPENTMKAAHSSGGRQI